MKDLSGLIFDVAAKTAPAERAEWLAAMRAELEHAAQADRLRFASGCVAAALVWRLWTPREIRRLAQGSLIAGSVALALVAASLTVLTGLKGGSIMMAVPAVAWGFGAFATVRWGLRGMAGFAICGIALNGGVVLAWAAGVLEPPLLARALSVEAVFILATFLSVAASTQVLATRMERGQ